jgi:hypothetical protein
MNDNKEKCSPLDRKAALPLIRLLRDPSEAVRTAALRALLVLLQLLPELRPEVEDYLPNQKALADFVDEIPSSDRDAELNSVVPFDTEADSPRQNTNDAPGCEDLRENAAKLADSILRRLKAGEFIYIAGDDREALRYLEPKRAALLVTALFQGLLDAVQADRDTGYMAGNEVALLVAAFGLAFVHAFYLTLN